MTADMPGSAAEGTADAYRVAGTIHGLVDSLTADPGPWKLMADPGFCPSTDGSCSFTVREPGSPPELYDVTVTPRRRKHD